MDVNNTRFQLLIGRHDWQPYLPPLNSGASPSVVWDERRHRVALRRRLLDPSVVTVKERLSLINRRGAGRDRYGNWYWIDVDNDRVLIKSPGVNREVYWPHPERETLCGPLITGDFRACEERPITSWKLSGLTVTTHHYLVVGILIPFAGIMVFDLHSGGPSLRIEWPDKFTFQPYDMAARIDGGVWILDGDHSAPKFWALDRFFRMELHDQNPVERQESDFVPIETKAEPEPATPTETVVRFPNGIPLPTTSPPEQTARPVAIESLQDGTSLIMYRDDDDESTWLARYRFAERIGEPVRVDPLVHAVWRGHDMAFVPGRSSPKTLGTLFTVGDDGRQAFAFDLAVDESALKLTLQDRQFLLRRFGGRAIVTSDDEVYADINDRWLPLRSKPHVRFETSGSFEVKTLDGKEPDCVWHRLLMDGCIPPGTSIQFESRAANKIAELASQTWQKEPLPYLRRSGSELPFYRPFSGDRQHSEGSGTWELLFQNARGRYLQLRITLEGTERNSPAIYALRAHYRRFSYVANYLPDVYQQNDFTTTEPPAAEGTAVDGATNRPGDVLERFLANPEGTLTELEGRIANLQTYFDERTIPTEYLSWLASWLGLVLGQKFNNRKRQLFIRHAIDLYRERGTLNGLARAVELALDDDPDERLFTANLCDCFQSGRSSRSGGPARGRIRIIEQFLLRRHPGVVYGDPTDFSLPRITGKPQWNPEQGAEPLHEKFREFLRATLGNSEADLAAAWKDYPVPFETIEFSPTPPSHPSRRQLWREFVRHELGFPYDEVTAADATLYRNFLRRRYHTVKAFNEAYGESYESFAKIELPRADDFPQKGARLADWIQFVSLTLPIRRRAHRFSVLVPIRPEQDPLEQQAQLDVARRAVEVQKPAHTNFEVKPYWELFQVGTARVGIDTQLDQGSRFTAILLGTTYLAGGYLEHPRSEADRPPFVL